MNILIAADLYYPLINGCSYFAQRLAAKLQEFGHNVLVIAPSETLAYTERVINDVRVFGVRSFPLFRYPEFRISLSPLYNKRIEKIITDFKPDVIHCQFHFGVNRAVLKVAKKNGIPTVATNHFMPDTMVHYVPFSSLISPMLLKLAWMDFARVYRKMDTVTTPTKRAASLIDTYFSKPVLPISCGIDLNKFKPNQDTECLRARYAIPDKPVLLYVGRLDKEKNLDQVIRAAAKAMQRVDFQLVLAGTGVLKKELLKLASSLGIADKITFTGFVPNDDLPNLYCLADCFIIAGTAELQSIVTMEAMATSLPVLAVDAVALPELVIDGENGFLFQLSDVEVLAQKMEIIFTNKELRERMAQKSYELIARHDINKVMKQFEATYKSLLTRH